MVRRPFGHSVEVKMIVVMRIFVLKVLHLRLRLRSRPRLVTKVLHDPKELPVEVHRTVHRRVVDEREAG